MNDRPDRRDYARLELERRFVLTSLPAAVDERAFRRLRDLFVSDTGLRLRRVEDPLGNELVTKLGQKLPDPDAPDAPGRSRLTTIYLPPDAAAPLQSLPGVRSSKRRYTLEEQGRTFAIDVWEEPATCAGLVLAEVECETVEQLTAVVMPAWAEREVTDDPRYSAFVLASEGLGK